MKLRRLAAILCAVPLLAAGCGGASSVADNEPAETTAPPPPSGLNLVTLGDSISWGYGLDDPQTQRYSALLSSDLEQLDSRKWNDYNYAVSGDDSSDLIQRLNDGKALRLPSADTIIIEIGANNLLGVYTSYMLNLADEMDIDPDTVTEDDYAEIQEKIEAQMQDPETIMADLQTKIDESLSRLETDLETIYAWVRERNADADIYVLNIYNPYAGVSESELMPEGVDFGDYSQSQIDRANSILKAFTDAHDDLILVDMAAEFAKQDPVPILGNQSPDNDDFMDPHPNAEGQRLIADLLKRTMRPDAES